MERPNIRNLVTATLSAHLNVPEHGIREEQEIVEDLGADSLDIVELTLLFEETFHVEIPDSDVEELKTVGDIVNLLYTKVSENMTEENNTQQEEETQVGGPEDEPETDQGEAGEASAEDGESNEDDEGEGSEED